MKRVFRIVGVLMVIFALSGGNSSKPLETLEGQLPIDVSIGDSKEVCIEKIEAAELEYNDLKSGAALEVYRRE